VSGVGGGVRPFAFFTTFAFAHQIMLAHGGFGWLNGGGGSGGSGGRGGSLRGGGGGVRPFAFFTTFAFAH